MNENAEIAKIFKALCDEKRVAIIKFLQTGEKCACDISEKLDIAQSKLSYHMKILCESGLIKSWYVGKWTHYQISKSGSDIAVDLLKELTNIETDCDNSLNKDI
ncbi:MAG: metalloregulator ArsR/SmtB family transcription factor [Clostridia bacterium]